MCPVMINITRVIAESLITGVHKHWQPKKQINKRKSINYGMKS